MRSPSLEIKARLCDMFLLSQIHGKKEKCGLGQPGHKCKTLLEKHPQDKGMRM
jgi:hypothetical protein